MHANISVHEPKQPVDEESPLAFSMEGLNRSQPGSLLPYVWAPGWNSNQSLNKFQSEVGERLKGGTAGARLLLPTSGTTSSDESKYTFAATTQQVGQWLMVPRYRIFGSDELSAQAPAIAELVDCGYIEVGNACAQSLGVIEGDGVELQRAEAQVEGAMFKAPLATLQVRINDTLADGCVGYSVGLSGTEDIITGEQLSLNKAQGWQRNTPQIIGTDGGSHV